VKEQKKVVIALGGNAIQIGDGSEEAQRQAIRKTVSLLVEIEKLGHQMVITHGNGPQVGNILLQQKIAGTKGIPPMSLDTCGAMSQGMIGYWIEKELDDALREQEIEKDVASIITRTEVDPHDPAFENPTKPIGPYYTWEEAQQLMKQTGAVYREFPGRGWRQVVPSPQPMNIIEHNVIAKLVNMDFIVICAGGGGIPVIREDHKYVGVEAVIDKDLGAEKLAELINADILLILTDVDHVFLNFGRPDQRPLRSVTTGELKKFIEEGHFEEGSMLPKVEAAIKFVESKPGRISIITSLDKALDALEGQAGTIVEP